MQHDYIIVGQGIAGTLVAHFLLQLDKKILVIDQNHQKSSSMVAAGLINPITGRNYVKSWRIDELIPFALKTYHNLEQELGISIFESKHIAMIFNNIKTENDWLVRSSNADVVDYVAEGTDVGLYKQFLEEVQGLVEFQHGGRVRLKELVLAYQALLQQKGCYITERFDFDALNITDNSVVYKDHQAARIIFAEGFQAIHNPYFNYLPFAPAKGDILIVRIPNYPATTKVVKHGVFIIPLGDDLYWIGSTYNRDYKTELPVEKDKEELLKQLKRVLKIPFEVVEHIAAVRPTVQDRRPFIGQHPNFKNLYLFNGMGAKGSYLTPLFAKEFVDYLESGKSLDKEIDIQRYYKYYR